MRQLNAILPLLTSPSLEDQLEGLHQAIALVKTAQSNAEAISPDDYATLASFLQNTRIIKVVAAQQLLALGPPLAPAIRQLMEHTEDPEVRTVAALLLREFGEPAAIPVLLESLRRGDGYFSLVARTLAQSHVQEAAPLIYDYVVTHVTIDQYDLLASSLAALRMLNFPIPETQRQHWLSDPRCHPYVRSELGSRERKW